jgi:hypothetical protein
MLPHLDPQDSRGGYPVSKTVEIPPGLWLRSRLVGFHWLHFGPQNDLGRVDAQSSPRRVPMARSRNHMPEPVVYRGMDPAIPTFADSSFALRPHLWSRRPHPHRRARPPILPRLVSWNGRAGRWRALHVGYCAGEHPRVSLQDRPIPTRLQAHNWPCHLNCRPVAVSAGLERVTSDTSRSCTG